MAVNLDTRLPLAAVGSPLNPAGVLQNARANAIQQKLDEMRMDYESRKRRRETDTERYMGEAINAIRQGKPAQTVTDFQWNTPNQTGVPQSPHEVSEREIAPAVPGRQPTLEDMQAASIDAMFKAGDIQGAFEAMKQARSGQASAMKSFGAETRTGEDGMEYAFNQATGRFEPTGFRSVREPVKPRVQTVRTARGIEVIDLNSLPPGTVLPPEQKPEPVKKPDITPYQKIQLEGSLRDDFRADSKVYDEIRRQHGLITTALKDKSAAGTLAAATSFMKMLDPGSVVRESELGMALASTGITDRIMNYANIIQSGKVLTEQQRNEFASLTNEFLKAAQAEHERRKNTYRQNAAEYGLSPERVVGRDYVQQPSQRPVKSAVQWLKSRKIQNQQQFNAEIRALRKQGWTEDEIRQATQEAGL
jgi:hypothetical protein